MTFAKLQFLLLSQLLRAPVGTCLVQTDLDGDILTLGIATTHPHASCPVCGDKTWSVHSRYTRRLAEEPAFGHQVRLQMTVRRFLCHGRIARAASSPSRSMVLRPSMHAPPCVSPKLISSSARPWVVRPEPGWRRRPPCRPAPIRCCDASSRHGARPAGAPNSSASMTGPGAKDRRYGTLVVDLETNDIIDLLPDAMLRPSRRGLSSPSRHRIRQP